MKRKIKIMAKYSNDSSEYKGNGHYGIDGIDYMSVWAFKERHNIIPNSKDKNGSEGKELISKGVKNYPSIPDFGGFGTIYIYPISDLEEYYGV